MKDSNYASAIFFFSFYSAFLLPLNVLLLKNINIPKVAEFLKKNETYLRLMPCVSRFCFPKPKLVWYKSIFLVLFFLSTQSLHAAIISSVQTGNYNLAGTWAGGLVPSATDTIIIVNGDTVKLVTNTSVTNLTIDAGGVLDNMGFTLKFVQVIITSVIKFTINGEYTGTGPTNWTPISPASVSRIYGTGLVSTGGTWIFNSTSGSGVTFDTSSVIVFSGSSFVLNSNNSVYCEGNLTFTNGSITLGVMNGTGSGRIFKLQSTGILVLTNGNINIPSGAVFQSYGNVTVGGSIFTGSVLTWYYNYAGATLNISGSLCTSPATGRLYVYSGSTVNFNGSGDQTITKPYSTANTYANLQCSNSGVKSLAANTIVTGNLIVRDAAQLDVVSGSDFSIDLKGNWCDSGSIADPFIEQTGTVTFSGTSAQTITASAIAGGETFHNLTVSNTSGDVSLSNDVTISNTLNFTAGKIILGTSDIIISTPTGISNYSNTNYVVTDNTGYLQMNDLATATFPVGPGTSLYNPVTISNTGTTGNFTVRVCDYVNTAGTCSGGTPVTEWGIDKTWTITTTSGTPNASVQLVWNSTTDEMTGFQPSNCAVNRHDGAGWTTYAFAGATDESATHGSGYYSQTATGVNAFSPFGMSGGGYPLPIELLSFTGEVNTLGQVVLNWTTATETNNDYFTVEKTSPDPSKGGELTFVPIGIVKGAGNSTTPLNYRFADDSPLSLGEGPGVRYYRLKQTDYDGNSSYSPFVSLILRHPNSLVVYPNPALDVVNLNIFGQKEELLNLSVIDKLGRTLISKQETIKEGLNSFRMDVFGLSNGAYLLQMISSSGVKEQKQLMINKQ